MRYPFFLLLICLLTHQNSKAQYVLSGKVQDKSDQPAVAANVVLLKDSNQLVKADVTNDKGLFTFDNIAAGNYFLKVTLLGYEVFTSAKIVVTGNTEIPAVTLLEKEGALKEVAIRAQKPFMEVKADRIVVNVENSIVSAGSSVMDVLERSPGVHVDQNDNISLKGKDGVMVWIDGKQTPMSGSDLANVLKSMPANAVDKIELISNPGARYDAAGNAGIINIKTKKDQRLGMNGSANVSYGQGIYPKYGAGINLNYRDKKFNLYASYNYSVRYWFNHLVLDRKFLDTSEAHYDQQQLRYSQDNNALYDFKNHIATIGIDYNLTRKTSVGVSFSGITNSFKPIVNNYSEALDANDHLIYNFITTGRHDNFYYNYSGNAYLRHSFDSMGKELNADLDYAAFGNQSNQNFVTAYTAGDGSQYQPDYFLKSDLTGLTQIRSVKADYINPLKGNAKLELGIKSAYVTADNEPLFYEKQGIDYELDTTRSNHFIYKENINAAYVNMNKDWTKWSTQIGLRMENTNAAWEQKTTNQKYDTSYVQLFPSLALQYHLNPRHDIGLTLSRRIERPNYQQLNPFKYFIDNTTYREGYPYLKPASFYSVELSHTYKQRFITTFTYGINKGIITEVIQPSETDTGRVTVQTNKNLDQMIFIGLSGAYPFQITRWWSNVTNFNAYYARYDGDIANTPIQNGSTTININTNNTFLLPNDFSAEVGGWYQAPQVYGYMDLKPTWALNAGIQKNLLKKTATLRLNIQDIFWTSYPRATSNYTGYEEYFIAERETRVVNIAFTYRFGKRTVAPTRRHMSGAEEEKNRANNNGA